MKINIQESLKELDKCSENKYNLYNSYIAANLTESEKKEVAKAIFKGKSEEELSNIINRLPQNRINLTESSYSKSPEEIEFEYSNLVVDIGEWVDADDFESDLRKINFTYKVDKEEVFEELIQGIFGGVYDSDFNIEELDLMENDNEVASYVEEHFEELVEKNRKELLECYRERAIEEAVEEFDSSEHIPVRYR